MYSQSKSSSLDLNLFQNPTAEYRGAPFWAWNTQLKQEALFKQIDIFKNMGMGGFHIHSRSGLATEYMGSAWIDIVKACHKKAVENNMFCYLYDEDRWPSGSAGGLVTQNHDFRQRFLALVPYGYVFEKNNDPFARYKPMGKQQFIARYKIVLENGFLSHYETLDDIPEDTSDVWEVYMDYTDGSPWFNNQAYVDTLNKAAIDAFIQVTHEPYKSALGDAFGSTVPAIFTDEPQFWGKSHLSNSYDKQALMLPYTPDFETSYVQQYGESFIQKLPEIFWELPKEMVSKTRYQYHDHVCERFTQAFTDNIGAWCAQNGILLTGHMMEEPHLHSQTRVIGETMRGYRNMQLPGIDMLCDRHEYTTAKQAQSATHQYGRAGVLSELYGVTNWDFDFRGHKHQGDWQAALGVTLRVHHLTWVSMAGEAKRDYPASIGYQSPWHDVYAHIEDHFARLNTALTRGVPIVRIGVIHPIESFWHIYGPDDKTQLRRKILEEQFETLVEWLLFNQLDFDFISESLLADLNKNNAHSAQFNVGAMAYDVVLVPNCLSLRQTTVNALNTFSSHGGTVVVAGDAPTIIDGVRVTNALTNFTHIAFAQAQILETLAPFRSVSMNLKNYIYQYRADGDIRWLFIANGKKPSNQDIPYKENLIITIEGEFIPQLYDTITGDVMPISASYHQGQTIIHYPVHMHDSLLFKLEKGRCSAVPNENDLHAKPKTLMGFEKHRMTLNRQYAVPLTPHSFTLSEPNVLVLDMAEYKLNNEAWQPTDELLRIDNVCRKALGFPQRNASLAQPWTLSDDDTQSQHELSLRFTIYSEIDCDDVSLALEQAAQTQIFFNGTAVDANITGFYVDHDIHTVTLPMLKQGNNELIVKMPFGQRSNVENLYLLGTFGVQVHGKNTVITKYPSALAFGDIRTQGLPFYGGNVTYHCAIDLNAPSEVSLTASYFKCPVIKVHVDDTPETIIAFAPYEAKLGMLSQGTHSINITAYGNRANTFGALHNCKETELWFGPNAWRTTGYDWSYEYVLKPTGILKSPEIFIKNN